MSIPTRKFSFLSSLWLMLTHPCQLSSVTTFTTFPRHFLTPPWRHPVGNTFYLNPSAVPPFFQEEMTSQEGVEGGMATFHCELSKAPACVQWKKGQHVLTSGTKYSMRQEGRAVELVVHGLDLSDTGDYSCVCGDKTSTAALTVHGNVILGVNILQTCPNLYCHVPVPLFAWFLWTLCVSSFCGIGKNIPCWCLSPSAVLVLMPHCPIHQKVMPWEG